MRFPKSILFLLFFLDALCGFSQSPTVVTGKVTDKKTHEPLEFANVRFKGSLNGVKTDSAGNFRISANTKARSIVVSYIAYQNSEMPVIPGQGNQVKVELNPLNINLKEVIVKPGKKHKKVIDTAAMYIFHQVVANKDQNKISSVDSYHFREYTKMVYSLLNPSRRLVNARVFRPVKFFFEKTDTTANGEPHIPMFVSEDLRDTWYRKTPRKKISVIHYRRMSGLKEPSWMKLIGYHFEVTDAYENVHIVFQKSFLSPFSPGASVVYNYHVIDTAKIDGRTSYRLNFVGKIKEDLCEKGYAWIDSATWAIKFISYRPNEKANLDYIYELLEEQTFDLVDNHWIMTKEYQYLEGNLTKNPKKMGIRIQKTTLRKDIATNVTLPDSILKAPDDIVDAGAYKRKFPYLDSLRFVALDTAEHLVYHHWDTIHIIPAGVALDEIATLITTANIKAGPVDFGRLYRVVSRNTVEGWRVRMGVRTNPSLSDKLYLGAYAAYGTSDKAWKYSFNARTLLPSKFDRWHAIELEYKSDMLVLGDENSVLSYDNITTLLTGYTLNKVMKTRELNLYYERDWIKGLSSNMELSQKTYFSVPPVFMFTAPDGKGNLINLPSFNTTEVSTDLRYCKTDYYYEYYTYRTPLQTKTPSITFKYVGGIKNDLFNGDYTYHKFSVQFVERWQLPAIGYSKIKIFAGYTLGNSPYPVSYISSSNIGILRDDLSFQATGPFEFVSDKYLIVWWEHYFDGFFLNRIPLLNRLHLREFVQCKALLGGFSTKNASLITLPSDISVPGPIPYVEVGAGIENILNLFQLGFFWRCTYRHSSDAPNFVIHLGIYPGF